MRDETRLRADLHQLALFKIKVDALIVLAGDVGRDAHLKATRAAFEDIAGYLADASSDLHYASESLEQSPSPDLDEKARLAVVG